MSRHRKGNWSLGACQLGGALACNLPADGVLDDVIDDVGWRVIDAAGLADLGLFLHFGLMARRQANDFAEKLLVNVAENFDWQNLKSIRRRKVQVGQDRLEDFVVHNQARRQLVRFAFQAGFILEMEQAGIVFVVGPAANVLNKMAVDLRAFRQLEQPLLLLHTPIFGHAEKNDTVDRELHRLVQVFRGKFRIAQGHVAREGFPPALDFFQEFGIDRGRRAFPFFDPANWSNCPPNTAA